MLPPFGSFQRPHSGISPAGSVCGYAGTVLVELRKDLQGRSNKSPHLDKSKRAGGITSSCSSNFSEENLGLHTFVAGTISVVIVIVIVVVVVVVVGLARITVLANVLAGGRVRPSVTTFATSDGSGVGDLIGGERLENGCFHFNSVVWVGRDLAALFFVAGMLGMVISGDVAGVFRGSAPGHYFGVAEGISDEVHKGLFILFHVVV